MGRKKKLKKSDVVIKSEVISFVEFFQSCLHFGTLKKWQEKEIKVFFRDLGLKDKEPLDTYRNALLKY